MLWRCLASYGAEDALVLFVDLSDLFRSESIDELLMEVADQEADEYRNIQQINLNIIIRFARVYAVIT